MVWLHVECGPDGAGLGRDVVGIGVGCELGSPGGSLVVATPDGAVVADS